MGVAPPIEAPEGVDPEAWAASVSALREACGWHVAPVARSTERVRVEGGLAVLKSLRVERVIEVRYRGVALDAGDYELMPEPIVRFDRWARPWSRPVIVEVTYEHGFEEMPDALVSLLSAAASRGVAGSLVTQVGQVRFGGSGILPGAAESLMASPELARYRLGPRP